MRVDDISVRPRDRRGKRVKESIFYEKHDHNGNLAGRKCERKCISSIDLKPKAFVIFQLAVAESLGNIS